MSSWNEQSQPTAGGTGSPETPERGRAAETVVQATGREPDELATDIGDIIRRNAAPLALVGAGIIWLAASQGRGRHAHDDAEAAASAVGDAGRRAASYARDVGSTARKRASEARHRASASASGGGAASERGRHAMESVRSAYRRNPLLVGLLTAGGTAALATAIAIRRNDGRVMQEVQEQASAVGQQAAHRAREEVEKARTVAERTAQATSDVARETAAEEAKREGLAGAEQVGRPQRSGGVGGASSGGASGASSSAGSSE